MVWKKVDNSDPGTADTFGGDDGDKISDLFSGVDVDIVDINADWTFRNGKLYIRNPDNTFSYNIVSAAIAADRTVNLPLLTATDTITMNDFAATLKNKTLDSSNTISSSASLPSDVVTEGAANSFGDFDNSFKDNRVRIWNPADTFRYTIVGGAITANRNASLPVLSGDDSFVFLAQSQSLSNKVILNSSISPSALSGDVNNYTPTGLLTANVVRLDSDSSFRTITGLGDTTQSDGTKIILRNISANTILLANQNGSSTAGNRFDFNGLDCPLFPKSEIELVYDGTLSRWIKTSHGTNHVIPLSNLGYQNYHDCSNNSGNEATFTVASGGTNTSVASLANHPGILNWTMGTSTTGSGGMRMAQGSSNTFLLGNSNYYRWDGVFRITTLSDGTNTYTLRGGFVDSTTAESTDGVFFRYTDSVNSGKWVLVARSNGSETTTNATNTAVAANTWYRLTVIVNPAGTSAEFFQDGVSLGTVGTTIPTGAGRNTGAGIVFLKSAGTSDTTIMDIDSQSLLYYFNTSR